MEAELNTIYAEFNGKYSKVCETYQDKIQKIDNIGDSIFLSTCIIFRDFEVPGSFRDVDKAQDYTLATGVDKRAEEAQIIRNIP